MVPLKKLMLLIFFMCFIVLTFSGCVSENKEITNELETPTIRSQDSNNDNLKNRFQKQKYDTVYFGIGDVAKAYPGLVFLQGTSNKKLVALTFDDGPDNYYTPQILDILNSEKVKVSFFVVGEKVKDNPAVMNRIISEGHFVGNHTWDHPYMPNLAIDVVMSEIQKTEDEIENFTGYKTAMFRPPYGVLTSDIAKALYELNYKIILWSSDSLDWKGGNRDQVESNILSNVKAGTIILQHCRAGDSDILKGTVQALPLVIERLKKEGFTFVTVPELLEIPGIR